MSAFRTFFKYSLVAGLTGLAIGQSALAQTSVTTAGKLDEQARLNACLDLIETDPDAAYEDGLNWSYSGNRPGARYCTALALIALGQAAEGAARLEALANASDAGSMADRTIYLAQAGNAWIGAGAPEAAIVTLTNALKLSSNDPDLYKDRASAHLMTEDWPAAITDLDDALALFSRDAEALRLRAQAHLLNENTSAALADINASLAIEGDNIDTLVLRGDVREAIRKAGG